jgi:hypothetical protein
MDWEVRAGAAWRRRAAFDIRAADAGLRGRRMLACAGGGFWLVHLCGG